MNSESRQQIRVLLIEGDEGDYLITRALLEEMAEYSVTLDWADNSLAAQQHLRRALPDVVLLDYRLGAEDGLEVLSALQSQWNVPVIILTGIEDYAVDVAVTKAGAYDYLVKSHVNSALLERSIRYASERKRMETLLRSALSENNRQAAAIHNLMTGVIITDPLVKDHPIIFVNPAFTEITGYSMMDATGHNCRFLQGPETDPRTVDAIRHAIALKKPFQGQILNYRKDGTPFWNDLRFQPLYQAGRLVNFVGLMHDVTSRVESEQRTGKLVVDLGERVKEMTALHAVARILQETKTSPEELLQEIVEQVLPAFQFPDRMAARLKLDDREYSTPHFQASSPCLKNHAVLSDGREVKLEVVYQAGQPMAQPPFIDEENSLLQSSVEMLCSRWERDMARHDLQTAHAELEERVARRTLELKMRTSELHESEERLRKINREILELSRHKFPPEAGLDEVFGAYTEAAVRSMDIERACAWIFNESRDALHCVDAFDIRVGGHENELSSPITTIPDAFSILQTERTLAITDVTQDSRLDGLYKDHLQPLDVVSLLIAPILKDGVILGLLALARIETPRAWTLEDQTYAGSLTDLMALELETLELQKTEESLRVATLEAEEARRAAEAANRAKSEFLSRMSHELRTPLNSILGFGQLLQRDQLSGKQQERVGLIVSAGQHLLALINEVLDIARVESGHLSLSIEPIQLHGVIGEALSLIAPLAARYNIVLKDEAPDESFFALADRQKLHQVMLNLLSNAVKYNKENGRVRVWCEAAPNHRFRISVANTGHGIAAENLKRIFLPFERLDAAQGHIEGTGLGLALVKRLLEAMDGTIEARSTPDGETVFAITLPVARNASPAPRATIEKVQQLLPEDQFRVLYIEDNLTNLKLIETIFSELKNVQLITAMQGLLGLELAREHRPDLILLDVHLPDIGGDEVLRSLKSEAQTRDIPVIIVSADATARRQKQLCDMGARHYLTKPLDIDSFVSAINEIVENKKLRYKKLPVME